MVKNLVFNAGDRGSIPGTGRSLGETNGHPLQYSCLENPMDRGAWWAIVHGVPELDMTEDTHLLHSLALDLIFGEVSYIGRAHIFVELKITFTFLI